MTLSEARKRAAKLRKEINHHRYLYHVLDKQEISEAALDSLKKELFDLEQEFPVIITPDSPTQRVGGEVAAGFAKVTHSSRMLSLNDAFSEEDMISWLERMQRFDPAAVAATDFFVEPKVDGLAISLMYEDGSLTVAATRGNGLVGEDVTHAVKTIESIPLTLEQIPQLKKAGAPKKIEIRGEVFMNKKEFEAINKERAKAELPLYMNPRNTAAGSVRQLDPKMTASRNLQFMAYSLPTDLGQQTHQEEHELLEALGFKTDPECKTAESIAGIMKLYAHLLQTRDKIPYQIDGVVIVVNSNNAFARLGIVGKAPRGSIALKFPAEQVTTVVEDIQVQVGRTGTLTPVAHLRPVQVAGSIVKRATLHNLDEVRRLDVRVGDTVIIEKAGDIIPDVVEVLKNLRPKNAKLFHMPKECPVCGSKVEQREGEVAFVCTNPSGCLAQQRERLYHFAGKDSFDFDGLGPAIIDSLMEAALVTAPADFYRLAPADLLPLERFAEKSAENTVAAIQARKHITFPRFIIGLGIRHVGTQTAINLANTFHSLKNLRSASLEQLQEVPDIGPAASESIVAYFADEVHAGQIDDLLQFVKVEEVQPAKKTGKLSGKTIVFTGTLETMSRDQAAEMAREQGATVASSVTRDLSYLVVGENAGSKLVKAEKQGTPVLTEKQFLDLIK